jgi:hypothetical protein
VDEFKEITRKAGLKMISALESKSFKKVKEDSKRVCIIFKKNT